MGYPRESLHCEGTRIAGTSKEGGLELQGREKEAAVPASGTLQRLAKAGGSGSSRKRTSRQIELPNYRLLKIT